MGDLSPANMLLTYLDFGERRALPSLLPVSMSHIQCHVPIQARAFGGTSSWPFVLVWVIFVDLGIVLKNVMLWSALIFFSIEPRCCVNV